MALAHGDAQACGSVRTRSAIIMACAAQRSSRAKSEPFRRASSADPAFRLASEACTRADRAQPLVDELARHVAVQVCQVALAQHQDMAAGFAAASGIGRGGCLQRAAEFVDEVLAVGQAGDRILVQFSFSDSIWAFCSSTLA